MAKFIEYFGSSHLNSMNVAAYEDEKGVILKAENVESDKVFGEIRFGSKEAAEDWFAGLPGINNISRLDSALNALTEKK